MSTGRRQCVLAMNVGSSSLKFGLHLVGEQGGRALLLGSAHALDAGQAEFSASDADGRQLVREIGAALPADALVARIAKLLTAQGLPAPEAIGHRIVHGGPALRQHIRIDALVLQKLDAAAAFAPLHVPPALAVVRSAQAAFADVPQIACLDTAFHSSMPEVARTMPIPADLRALGIERYGFHGLSCESIVAQLGAQVAGAGTGARATLPARLVIAHLGHGASVTAVAQGHSIDTSMGLTPTGGVPMGTRCGDLDPAVLIYCMREQGYDAPALEAMTNHRSGLLGISGISGDMRTLRATSALQPQARLAIAMFCYAVRKQIGAMAAVLGGLDLLAFTGGIGENDAQSRATICEGLDYLGVGPGAANVRVLPAQEDVQIARHAWRLVSA